MSVLIKGMEMPKNCKECMFADFDDVDFDYVLYCTANEKYADLDMYDHPMGWNCPLVEIPTPHGRLIDKDKLRHELFVNFDGQRIPFYDCDNFPTKIAYRDLHSILAEQKTVIEAEGSETRWK